MKSETRHEKGKRLRESSLECADENKGIITKYKLNKISTRKPLQTILIPLKIVM